MTSSSPLKDLKALCMKQAARIKINNPFIIVLGFNPLSCLVKKSIVQNIQVVLLPNSKKLFLGKTFCISVLKKYTL